MDRLLKKSLSILLFITETIWCNTMIYYTENEMKDAIDKATKTINLLTDSFKEYERGANDCFALFAEYDIALRGEANSKARDLVQPPWKSTKEWCVKLARKGYSVESFAQHCGYEIIMNKRPKLGDIAFYDGAMICNGDFWISTKEDNTGVYNKMRKTFYEMNIPSMARPVRS